MSVSCSRSWSLNLSFSLELAIKFIYLQIANTEQSNQQLVLGAFLNRHEWMDTVSICSAKKNKYEKKKHQNNNIRITNWAKRHFTIDPMEIASFFAVRKQKSENNRHHFSTTFVPFNSIRIVFCAQNSWRLDQAARHTYVPFTITFRRRLLNNHACWMCCYL